MIPGALFSDIYDVLDEYSNNSVLELDSVQLEIKELQEFLFYVSPSFFGFALKPLNHFSIILRSEFLKQCPKVAHDDTQQTPNNSYITVSYNFPLNNITVT